MSTNQEVTKESLGSPERHQYDETVVLVRGIECALDGYARDGEAWEYAKETFEAALAEGERADDALNQALEVIQDGAESTSQEAAKRFWSTVPTNEAIEGALNGYANSPETWRLSRWTFEDLVDEGVPVEKALDEALRLASDGSESTPTQATLRFWNRLQPSYIKRWLELPMNNAEDGIVLGRRIHRPVGKGEGAGTYIGDHNGQAVIVKHGEKETIKNEYEILSSVDYPGIPHVTSYSEDLKAVQGQTRLSMEMLPGTSLDKIVHLRPDWTNTPLSVDRAVRIGLGVAGNFKALSDAGYLYRDLNLGHIIIDEKNGRLSVGLVDVESSLPKNEEGMAIVGRSRGTWEMMSPEEFEEDGGVMTEASSVYSVGCLIRQLVTGESKFNTPVEVEDGEMYRAEMLAAARAPHMERPDVPIDGLLGDVLVKALDPDPNKRYQTLDEFADALRETL